jgi:myo-inositol-1(or 4)-monophosphatase
MQPDISELTTLHGVAVLASEAAGAVIRAAIRDGFSARYKRADTDVVTSVDLSAEASIVSMIHEYFPTHQVVTEESGELYADRSPWTWLVDPLDGSNNLAIGLPTVAVGLAVCHRQLPLVAVVHEPLLPRTWSAIRGVDVWDAAGRTLACPASDRARVRPILAWSQGYGVAPDDRRAAALRSALQSYARRVLELWATLPAWMMLARGDIDGIVGFRIGELDLHAGALIASMCGIEIRELDGGSFNPSFASTDETRSLVAARPESLSTLLGLIGAGIA